MRRLPISGACLLLLIFLAACRPQSKESYLERYDEFIKEVTDNSANYTETDWQAADEKYKKFNEEWYDCFREDLTWQEKLITTRYSLEYNFYKAKPAVKDMYETYIKGNLEETKQKIKYYRENQMDEDIQDLLDYAKELGDTSAVVIQNIIDEVDKEIREIRSN